MMQDISAVIPCYNGEKFIETALNSIAAQTYPVQEIIVVDDGSADDSIKRIENWRDQHPSLKLEIIRQRNQGVAVARNTGWKAASSTWIAFLDADDIWYPHHNEALLQAHVDKNSQLVFCDADRAQQVGDQETALPTFFEIAGIQYAIDQEDQSHHIGGNVHHRLLAGSFLPICCNLVKKTALEDIKGFEEGRAYGEDRQAWLKLFTLGPVNISKSIAGKQLYHGSNATHSRHAAKELKARLDLLNELIVNAPMYKLGEAELKIVRTSLNETLADFKYTLSCKGLTDMRSEGPVLKRYGAQYSLKDFARGLLHSLKMPGN
ncbi:glycosyltransferase family 2 protein [Govanella unica]|uniref:Glycosyltransferase family 2 protein n=1 Tax=Govanella unica TaxID=2975056 RepID=A0A9X3TY93_9PROT|nr:glycosyltransferase family A protein [Govania unica]MDA5193887.1 glycosyltransferase family 2 protein [Govania unica]